MCAPFCPSATLTVQVSFMAEGGSGAPVPVLPIEVDDLGATLTRLKRARIQIEYRPTLEPWGVPRFCVRDPFGKFIIVLAHESSL